MLLESFEHLDKILKQLRGSTFKVEPNFIIWLNEFVAQKLWIIHFKNIIGIMRHFFMFQKFVTKIIWLKNKELSLVNIGPVTTEILHYQVCGEWWYIQGQLRVEPN